jgi:PAS domain S-box-containing protein
MFVCHSLAGGHRGMRRMMLPMAGKHIPIGDRTAIMYLPTDEISRQIRNAHHEWLAALDTIQDPIFMHDAEFRVTRSNRAYAELAGMSVKAVIGKPYYEIFPKSSEPLPLCRRLVQEGGEGEEEIFLDNGRVYLSRAAAVTDGEGCYLYSLHIMYDITERKQMEQAMRDGEERLRMAFSAAHQAWFDLDVQTGKATISPEYANMMGYDPAEFDPTYGHWTESLHPDDREKVMQAFARCQETGGPVTMEFRRSVRTGEWIWLSAIAKMVGWDAQHKPLRMIGIMTDITDRKRAELALSKSEARFRSMFESLAEGVLLYSQGGTIQLCNPAAERILGLEREQVIGSKSAAPGWTVLHEEGTPFAADELPVVRTLKTGVALTNIVIGLVRESGEKQWLNVNSEPLYEPDTRGVAAAIVSFEDITLRKRSEERLLKLNHALETIGECNRTLVFAEDEQQLLRDMCTVIVETGGYHAAWVGYAEHDENKSVLPRAQYGFDEGHLESLPLSWADNQNGQWPVARAIRSGQVQISQDITVESCFRDFGLKPRYPAGSCIALPLKEQGTPIGSLNIYAHEINTFNDDEVRLLKELADDLGFGIGTMRLRRNQEKMLKQLRDGLEGTVQAVSAMVEMRDPYTAGHERRVAELACAIAVEMGLDEERVRGIHLAGTVHDLGKIQIPAEILSKPGRLTEVEFSLIRQHPKTGYEILKNIEFPWPIAQMILQHHERMDGSGYPQGLKGDEILIEARILAVSDVVEAMASHRPYRPGLGVSSALDEIRKNRGKFYDEHVVDACVKLFEEKQYVLPEVWTGHKPG